MNPYTEQVTTLTRSTWAGRLAGLAVAAALLAPSVSCTSQQLKGTSPAYLIIDAILGAPGASPEEFGGQLASDVLTNGGIFADNGQVTLRVAMKDPGSATSPSQPTTMNYITVTRYRVDFIRSDGRNTPGVDVPFGFDGAVTVTVDDTGDAANFTLVRVQAKLEAPLLELRRPNGLPPGGASVISTLAQITFYGADQAGRTVSVTGTLGVNFADWADPAGGRP